MVLGCLLYYLTFLLSPTTSFAAGNCYCEPNTNTSNIDAGATDQLGPQREAFCIAIANNQSCTPKDLKIDEKSFTCDLKVNDQLCGGFVDAWKKTVATKVAQEKKVSGVIGLGIPACLAEPTLSPDCRDISIFIKLLINLANWAFGIIGALALVVFIYGGFMLIISGGNSEKVQQGMGILTAAVIGLFIAFAGYMLIQFIGTSLNIKDVYRLS